MHGRSEIRISLLGKPALFVGDELRLFGGPRKAIALLAYLLLHRGRSLSRTAVAEQFWPDDDDESARAALRRHLYRALGALPRAAPDTPWVVADKTTLHWNAHAPVALDTTEYERLANDGARAAAVALYRGDYVEDFYDGWIIVERERLRSLHATNLIALVDEQRAALDYRAAIGYAEALLRMDGLREDALRRLMSLRYAAGDRSGALAEFEAFNRRVREELDTEPMPETIALREAIRRDDLVTLQPAGPASSQPGVGLPFVGRRDALRSLRRAWEGAARGRGATVLLTGEAGIGKTRSIGEFAASVTAQGGRVAFGTTSATEAEPYQPVVEALRAVLPLLRFEAVDTRKLAVLATLLPEVRDSAASAPPEPLIDSERERHRLFDAIAAAFEEVAAKRPLLAVFEDVHWASAATMELLEFLVRRLRAAAVLAVLTVREESVDANPAAAPFIGRLDARHAEHVALGPLGLDDVRQLAEAAAPGEGATELFVRDLNARAGGNPLFLTELLREHASGADANVPRSIGEMVAGRVERLSEPARSLLETAAVAGAGFDANVVRAVLGWTFAETFDALDELLDRALVRESTHRRGDFLFSHQLVHAAVYDAMAVATRRRLHRRMGRTLERVFPGRPALFAVLVRHFNEAGASEDVLRVVQPAVDHALSVFSYGEAIALGTVGLALADEPRLRFALHRAREEAATRTGDVTQQEREQRAMRALAGELDDADLIGLALCRSIGRALGLGETGDERTWIDELRQLARRTAPGRWSLEATLAEARMLTGLGDVAGATALLAQNETAVRAGAESELAFEYWTLRSFISASDSLAAAAVYLEEARSLMRGSRMLHVRYLRAACNLADRSGDVGALRGLASELLQHYVDIGDVEGQGLAHQNLAITGWYALDLASQREHFRRALHAFERTGKRPGLASVLLNRGVCAQHVGAFEAAESDYREARAIAEEAGRRILVGLCDADLASLATFREDYARARLIALEVLGRQGYDASEIRQTALLALGVAERELGEPESARAHLEEALALCRARDPRVVLEILIDLVPVYLALGEPARALECAEELERGLQGDRRRVTFPAHALHSIATALFAAGKRDRATTMAREAAALFETLAAGLEGTDRAGYRSLPIHRGIGAVPGAPSA